MRVDDRDTIAVVQISDDHVAHQGGLAHTRLTEDRHVLTANVSGDADQRIVAMFCAEEDFHKCVELYTRLRDPARG